MRILTIDMIGDWCICLRIFRGMIFCWIVGLLRCLGKVVCLNRLISPSLKFSTKTDHSKQSNNFKKSSSHTG